jgi:hypothetical protein
MYWSPLGGTPAHMEHTMTTPKDIINKLEECIGIAKNYDDHINNLTQEVARLRPSHDAVEALLKKHGFSSEPIIEENLRLFVDHHTKLVAENTKLQRIISDRDELMEQLRKVVTESAD